MAFFLLEDDHVTTSAALFSSSKMATRASSSAELAPMTRSSASVALLDHILSVAGLVVALAVAQLIIVRCRCQRRSPLEPAQQPRLLWSSVILLSLFREGEPFSAALVAAVVVALSLHVLPAAGRLGSWAAVPAAFASAADFHTFYHLGKGDGRLIGASAGPV